MFAGGDEHGFDYQQVVVERDHRVEQGDENQQMKSLLESGREDEELREKACEGRNACQREEREGHQHGQLGVGAVETVVVLDANFPVRMLFDGRNDAENRQVGCHIDQDVVNQRSHAQGRTADHAQHDVARLRDG